MKIGAAPISWGISEIAGWGPQKPYPEVLDEMAAAGYEGTELGPAGYLPDDPAVLGPELERRNLTMVAAFVPVDMRNRDAHAHALADVDRTARLLAELGAEQLVLADGGDARRYAIAGRPAETLTQGMNEDQWSAFIDGVHVAAELCSKFNLELCVHPHGGSYIEHPAEIERLLETTDRDSVKLCFDTGHITFGGGDVLQCVQRYGDRIGLVHLKDVDVRRLRAGVAVGNNYTRLAQGDVFVSLGSGSLDMHGFISALQTAAYDGWVVVEQDRVVQPHHDALTDALRNREFLKENFGL